MTRWTRLVLAAVLVFIFVGVFIYWKTWTAPRQLLMAIYSGNDTQIRLLTALGADPDTDIWLTGGLLHCAAARGAVESMARLVSLGADVNRLDGYGVTPVMVAIKMNEPKSYHWLVSHGADLALRSRDGETTDDYLRQLDEGQRKEFSDPKK